MDQDQTLQGRPQWHWGRVGKLLLFITAGLLFTGWLYFAPSGVLGKMDAVGYAVCHRIDARSFHLGDRQLPLCVRCSGMYLGVMVGLVYHAVIGGYRNGMPPRKFLAVFALMFAAFGIDGTNSYLHLIRGAPSLYEPQHLYRLITGTGMGLVMAGMIFPAYNQTVWKMWDERPVLDSWRKLLIMLGLAALFILLVLTESPLVLYPLAWVSAAGVLVILTMIYSMVWVMLLRMENRYERWSQLAIPLIGGFTLAIGQIFLFNLVRFWLTGTWSGFQLG